MFLPRFLLVLCCILPIFAWAEELNRDAHTLYEARVIVEQNNINSTGSLLGINPIGDVENGLFAENLQSLLAEHLSLISKRNAPNLDIDQIQYLIHGTPNEVEQILNTRGYFNNQTHVVHQNGVYEVRVQLGKLVKVENIIIDLQGEISEDAQLPYFYRDIFMSWTSRRFTPFSQDKWAADKASALAAVRRKKYPLARMSESEVIINPTEATAVLKIVIDSGSPIKFGAVVLEGHQRYRPELALNLAGFSEGSDYDSDKLLDYQTSLEQDGHFGSVMVRADFEQMNNNIVPVVVTVEEVPLHKVDVGLLYNTLDGPGIRLGYDYYNLFNRAYMASGVLEVNRYEQTLGLGLSTIRNRRGYFYTGNLSFTNIRRQKLDSQRLSAGGWRVRVRGDIDARVGVEYFLEQSKIVDGPVLDSTYVTMLTASWKRNQIQTRSRPSNGIYLSGKIGSTVGTALSTANVQRVTAEAAVYYTPKRRRWGTGIVHGKLGYVHTGNDTYDVPTALLFRTGGGDSVRGYSSDSIGMAGPNGSVLGGKVLALASVEYQYPITRNWSVAVFHDVGDVKNNFKDLDFKHATGVGARWFSPVAPLSFDIARAQETGKLGWYIGLGTKF